METFSIYDNAIEDIENEIENIDVCEFSMLPDYSYISVLAMEDNYAELLEYIGTDIDHLFTKEELIKALSIESEIEFLPFDVETEFMTYQAIEDGELSIIRATPVMLALHIKKYDLATKLLLNNHPSYVDDTCFAVCITGRKKGNVERLNVFHYIECDRGISSTLAGLIDANIICHPSVKDIIEIPNSYMCPKNDAFRRVFEFCPYYRDRLYECYFEEIACLVSNSSQINEDFCTEIQSRYLISLKNDKDRLGVLLDAIREQSLKNSCREDVMYYFSIPNIVRSRRRALRALKGQYKRKMAEIIVMDYLRLYRLIEKQSSNSIVIKEYLDSFFLEALKNAYSKEFFTYLIYKNTDMLSHDDLVKMIIMIKSLTRKRVPIMNTSKCISMLHLMYINSQDDLLYERFTESIMISEKDVLEGPGEEADLILFKNQYIEEIVRFGTAEMMIAAINAKIFEKQNIIYGVKYALEIERVVTVPAMMAGR